ncbi:MAG: glycosyltransferase family 2 protein [Candidatus Saccharimonadales bacterium]
MSPHAQPDISVVVPVYNEAKNIESLHTALTAVLEGLTLTHEIWYVDDGSTDDSLLRLQAKTASQQVHVLSLVRNFGKEAALTAGLRAAKGRAVMMLDADGQHPVDRIPAFIEQWQSGSRVVVGKRHARRAGMIKKLGSRLYYGVFSWMARLKIDPSSSDFRLIDREVCDEFNSLGEHNRMTRRLIDWFGYEQAVIPYHEQKREEGDSPYTTSKLFKLAVDSAISHSVSPLYGAAFAGFGILLLSIVIGLVMSINFLLGDPLGFHATASAYGLVLILFLIGLLLISQGIIGLYLSHIHTETQSRPLYVIDEKGSRR